MSDLIDYTSLFRLDGRKVVVVGGGSGLGRAASIALAQYGATLVVADVNVEGLKDTVAEIEAQGYSAESAEVDVTDTESVDALAAAGVSEVLRRPLASSELAEAMARALRSIRAP